MMAALIAAAALPAQAQDVLQCTDTGVTGFKWEQGAASPPRVTMPCTRTDEGSC